MWNDYEIYPKSHLKPVSEPLCEEARTAVIAHLIEKKRALESQIFEIELRIQEITRFSERKHRGSAR